MRIRITWRVVWVLSVALLAVLVTGSWWAALFVYLGTFELGFKKPKPNPIAVMKAWYDFHNDGSGVGPDGQSGYCKQCGAKMSVDMAGWLCPNNCPTHTW